MASNNNTPGVLSLRQIVMSYKARKRSPSMNDYEYLMQLAIEAFTYINIFQVEHTDVAYLQLDHKNCVDLPSDFIDYTKVAIDLCGRYYTLTLNNDIIPPRPDLKCGLPIEEIAAGCCENGTHPIPSDGYYFVPHYRNDTLIPTFFAAGGGWSMAGQYKIDRERRQLIVTGVPKSEIVLEYRSSGVKIGEKTFVPSQYRECIIAFLAWKEIEYGHAEGNLGYAERRYKQEETLVKTLDYARTYEEYLDMMYQSWQQGIKR